MVTNTISALGAGSGVDIKTLATNLVDAERAPVKAAIDKKVTASQNTISGYSAIMFVLDNLKTAFADLKNQSSFASITPSISQPAAYSVTPGASAASGSHTVKVNVLAAPQRSLSSGFLAANTPLNVPVGGNQGAAFSLSLSIHGGAAKGLNVDAANASPAGVVSTINQAGLGVTASLINTGNAIAPYKIMITGATGVTNDFVLTSSDGGDPANPVPGLDFGDPLQFATNADLEVDGVPITSSSNKVTGALADATLNLTGITNDTSTLDFTRDSANVKTKLQTLVTAYNDAVTMLGVVSDPKSTVETYGATMVGNTTVSFIRNQIRNMVVGDSSSKVVGDSTSKSGPTSAMTAMRDLGITIDRSGVLQLDATKLDTALSGNFDNVVTMLSDNRENLSTYSALPAGLAGDSVKKLTELLGSTGPLTVESRNATARISTYNDDLAKLETRMAALLARYNTQFSIMDSMVGQTNSMRTGLTSTFESMMASYTNK
jgi:flagellar hook-associated protein 2